MKDEIIRHQIKVEIRSFSGSSTGYAFLDENNEFVYPYPNSDFFLNVFLKRSTKTEEYVDVQKDTETFQINRQLINPYFIEYAFFDTITKNKIINGSDLTQRMINVIRGSFANTAGYSNQEVIDWFDYEGKNIIIKNEKTNTFPTLDDLERSDLVWENIVSKANYFPIDIIK